MKILQTLQVSESTRTSVGDVLIAEENKGNIMKDKEPNLLKMNDFQTRVDHAKFVVIVDGASKGTGVILR